MRTWTSEPRRCRPMACSLSPPGVPPATRPSRPKCLTEGNRRAGTPSRRPGFTGSALELLLHGRVFGFDRRLGGPPREMRDPDRVQRHEADEPEVVTEDDPEH